MSKIIRIFLKIFFIEEYQFRGIFVVIDIFWKLKFLNHFVTKIKPIFQSPQVNFLCQKYLYLSDFFFIEEYKIRGMFFVNYIFWKLQFLKPFVTRIMAIFQWLTTKNIFLWKSAIDHSIKLPFDAEVAEKFSNGIYYLLSAIVSLINCNDLGLFLVQLHLTKLIYAKLITWQKLFPSNSFIQKLSLT